jgi:hypothetical protein
MSSSESSRPSFEALISRSRKAKRGFSVSKWCHTRFRHLFQEIRTSLAQQVNLQLIPLDINGPPFPFGSIHLNGHTQLFLFDCHSYFFLNWQWNGRVIGCNVIDLLVKLSLSLGPSLLLMCSLRFLCSNFLSWMTCETRPERCPNRKISGPSISGTARVKEAHKALIRTQKTLYQVGEAVKNLETIRLRFGHGRPVEDGVRLQPRSHLSRLNDPADPASKVHSVYRTH